MEGDPIIRIPPENTSQISFHPKTREELPSAVLNRLDAIKEKKGLVVGIDDAKFLFQHRHYLNWPDDIKKACIAALAKYYDLPQEATLQVEANIAACLDLETFGIDPKQALSEYRQMGWRNVLKTHVLPTLVDKLSFAAFIQACKAAALYQMALSLKKTAEEEAQTIQEMSPSEWKAFRQGKRWSQQAYAEYNAKMLGKIRAKQVLGWVLGSSALFFASDPTIRETVLQEVFLPLATTQNLVANAKIVEGFPSYPTVDSLLVPNPQKRE